MSHVRALCYADWRAALNDARRVIRSPGRLAVWILYAASLGFFLSSRVAGSRHTGSNQNAALATATADYFVCVLLVSLVFAFATGRGATGIFRSRVEARFIIGSPIGAPLAIAYLQARETLAQSMRFLFSLVYLLFFFGPRELGPFAMLLDIALVLGVYAAAAAVVVPRRLLGAAAGLACGIAGIPLGLLALAPALRDAVQQVPMPAELADCILAVIPAWHPGRVLLEPNLGWLLAAVALAACAIGILAAAGRDAYPELYALSIARIELRERRRIRSIQPESSARAMRPLALVRLVPRGVLVFVWKSVVEFGRGRRRDAMLGGAALWCLAGFALARLAAAEGDAVFWTLASVAANLLLFGFGVGATTALAGELRRPLFWLARAAMFERLCALALAQVWRPIVSLELIAAGVAAGGGSAAQLLVCALGLPTLVALLAGVGFAAAALFPSPADARGPIAALRFGVAALLLVPPLIVFAVGAAAFGMPVAALVVAALLALVEAGSLVGIAAWRIDGHIDRLPALN